ncbi:MAG: hypothetical protein UX65_C0002G0035 [Parcubacteria group bacterium GW2011_GWB1_46_8]|nr:MAG: hypothetical protein UX14_C0004G0026 [Parcubacteria group bacterium GW2011_GWF1_45_5]KKU11558.1 MAG: hypothetical protein UX15_C0002G0011 [Parcubacteria group bacterium GW2011_GWA1_45_7]KKU44365.1 MAG: hypothetical protein UX61_C0002G0008 [Parcubacteria group bacterium GW2011_GWA2_46_7]KKU46561.1 MAG: hypothetical protein UX65_C0002G0035 [Parcubacteria group bacterium GW2011_GWB1_46_8]KKU48006.1 MAG: hypothetical protein UX66_C0001G0025 [Parcubacteria group bacterium GW2011_GWF2_46_8]
MNMRKSFFLASVFILGCLVGVNYAFAQISITLYPTSFRVQIDPGKTWEGTVTVVNPNSDRLGVKVEKENLSGGAEGSIELMGEETNQIGLASWISVDRMSDTLNPNEKKEFYVSISVPSNAPPGGHYAALLFRGISSDTIDGNRTGVGIGGRVGTVILVEVSGEVQKSGSVVSVEANKFQSHGPIDVAFKVKNTGNSYFSPEGKIVFKNLWRTYEGTWEPRVVFPGFDRTFKSSWAGKYFVGPVRATVFASIPGLGELPVEEVVVWVFPWQEVSIGIGILLVIWLGMRIGFRNFKIVRVSDNSTNQKSETQNKKA